MDDLTQRLRRGLQWSDDGWPVSGTSDDMQAAAARIEALEAERDDESRKIAAWIRKHAAGMDAQAYRELRPILDRILTDY